jgi:predicted nucleic acid-binding protein
LRAAEIVRDLPPITGVVRDPNDDMILACAAKAEAAAVVTRDNDLLTLVAYQGVAIITPEVFRRQLRGHA